MIHLCLSMIDEVCLVAAGVGVISDSCIHEAEGRHPANCLDLFWAPLELSGDLTMSVLKHCICLTYESESLKVHGLWSFSLDIETHLFLEVEEEYGYPSLPSASCPTPKSCPRILIRFGKQY